VKVMRLDMNRASPNRFKLRSDWVVVWVTPLLFPSNLTFGFHAEIHSSFCEEIVS